MVPGDFAKNLKLICGFEKSVSSVCRAVGINRQQFSKYLNGTSQPSPNNLQRICDHFAIRPADLYLPHDEFADRMQFRPGRGGKKSGLPQNLPLKNAFPGDLKSLRRYLGYYLVYCHSGTWDDHILCAMSHIYEVDGIVCSKSIERSRDPEDGTLYLSKYEGLMSFLGNRLFVIEHQSLANDAIVETMLYPLARSQLVLLHGTTLGLSSKRRDPYVSQCVWKYLGKTVDLRAMFGAVGLIPIKSNRVDPNVLRILGDRRSDLTPNHA